MHYTWKFTALLNENKTVNYKKRALVFCLFLSYKYGWVLKDKDVGILRQKENAYIRKMYLITCAAWKCVCGNLFSLLLSFFLNLFSATWLFPGSQTWAFLSQTFNQHLLMNPLLHLQMNKGRKINTSDEGSKSTWPVYGKCKTKTWRKTIYREVAFTERFSKLLPAISSYIGTTGLWCSTADLFNFSFSEMI